MHFCKSYLGSQFIEPTYRTTMTTEQPTDRLGWNGFCTVLSRQFTEQPTDQPGWTDRGTRLIRHLDGEEILVRPYAKDKERVLLLNEFDFNGPGGIKRICIGFPDLARLGIKGFKKHERGVTQVEDVDNKVLYLIHYPAVDRTQDDQPFRIPTPPMPPNEPLRQARCAALSRMTAGGRPDYYQRNIAQLVLRGARRISAARARKVRRSINFNDSQCHMGRDPNRMNRRRELPDDP